jgi:isopentenyl-diphosphate delta-isomerase
MLERVILVNDRDEPVGVEEKLLTHREGKLHRGFSVFVFNAIGETLLQQRALSKYHGGGLWANTCCGHPRPAEEVLDAAHRRLQEEMGFDCQIRKVGSYIYHVPLDNVMTEHEFLHVFAGKSEYVAPVPNPEEVMAWKWVSLDYLRKDMKQNPAKYAYWFRKSMKKLFS